MSDETEIAVTASDDAVTASEDAVAASVDATLATSSVAVTASDDAVTASEDAVDATSATSSVAATASVAATVARLVKSRTPLPRPLLANRDTSQVWSSQSLTNFNKCLANLSADLVIVSNCVPIANDRFEIGLSPPSLHLLNVDQAIFDAETLLERLKNLKKERNLNV